MLVAVLDGYVLDGRDSGEGQRQIGVRTKGPLGILKLEGLKMRRTRNDGGELLCNHWGDRCFTEIQ